MARNESAVRKVNEGIDAGRGLTEVERVLTFVCECGRLGCTQLIELSVTEYEHVRSSGRRFVVLADHVDEDSEEVVDRADGWVVVEKTGAAGEAAERLDPRGA